MEVHVMDDQIGRYFRRIQLGLRFLAHGARAQTTCKWSGLTPDQLVTLRRRWKFNSDDRLRGPSPSSFEIFFRSRHSRAQAALFLGIARTVGAMPARPGADDSKSIPSLENGERLCEAFEAFREWEPQADYDFEQAVLLLTGAARADKIELTYCPICSIGVLRDKLAGDEAICLRCRRKHGSH